MQPYRHWPFLSAPEHPVLSALWEVLAHGVLGVVAVLPLLLAARARPRTWLAAFAGGIVLDVDHAVAARSLDPGAMERLGARPDTHSLVFATVLAVAAWLLTRRARLGWAVFALLAAHLLFDAPGGGVPLTWPFGGPAALPWLACPAGMAALVAVSAAVARWPARSASGPGGGASTRATGHASGARGRPGPPRR